MAMQVDMSWAKQGIDINDLPDDHPVFQMICVGAWREMREQVLDLPDGREFMARTIGWIGWKDLLAFCKSETMMAMLDEIHDGWEKELTPKKDC